MVMLAGVILVACSVVSMCAARSPAQPGWYDVETKGRQR